MCLEDGCVKTAAWVLESVKPDICPCKDFFGFVCGNWIEKSAIPQTSNLARKYSPHFYIKKVLLFEFTAGHPIWPTDQGG